MQIKKSSEVLKRTDFPTLFNKLGYRIGVELGVDQGKFAEILASGWNGKTLYCVDPWAPYLEMVWDRDVDRQFAISRLSKYADKVRIATKTGREFLDSIPFMCPIFLFDFVYIDAKHDVDSVREDLNMWWDRLSDRGMICGHDFDQEHHGVVEAVTEFARSHDRDIFVTTNDATPSWYMMHFPNGVK